MSEEMQFMLFIAIAILLFIIVTLVKILLAIDAILSMNKNVKKILELLESHKGANLINQAPHKPVEYNNEITEHPKVELGHKSN